MRDVWRTQEKLVKVCFYKIIVSRRESMVFNAVIKVCVLLKFIKSDNRRLFQQTINYDEE